MSLKVTIVFLVIALLPLSALAQNNKQASAPLSIDLFKCVEGGKAGTLLYIKTCASPDGNLILFKSPWGMEHIRVGAYLEGYAVCYGNTSGQQTAYDVGPVEAGWAAPYRIDGQTFPLTIYRRTLDGQLELVQRFALDGPERDVTLTMTLYNRSNLVLSNVMLERHVDFDVDNDYNNDWYNTNARGLVAWKASPGSDVVSMTNLTTGVSTQTLVEDNNTWSDLSHFAGCRMVNSFSNPGDNQGAIRYLFSNMAPGTSKTVTIVYRAF